MKKLLLFLPALVLFTACSAQPTVNSGTIEASPSPTDSSTTQTSPAANAEYSMSDVQQHGSASDCWLVVSGSVYNVTSFIPNHPGGEEILKGCGRDATSLFSRQPQHEGPDAQAALTSLKIGTLKQ